MIDFVDHTAFHTALDSFHRAAILHDTKRYEDWLPYHRSVVAIAGQFGQVTDDSEGGDFYHGLDWFLSLTDAFVVRTVTPFSKMDLHVFQHAVAGHSPHALLTISGEMQTPIDGLEIMIHSQAILIAWNGKNRDACRHQLASLGLRTSLIR